MPIIISKEGHCSFVFLSSEVGSEGVRISCYSTVRDHDDASVCRVACVAFMCYVPNMFSFSISQGLRTVMCSVLRLSVVIKI